MLKLNLSVFMNITKKIIRVTYPLKNTWPRMAIMMQNYCVMSLFTKDKFVSFLLTKQMMLLPFCKEKLVQKTTYVLNKLLGIETQRILQLLTELKMTREMSRCR